jgi:hypothetical protein
MRDTVEQGLRILGQIVSGGLMAKGYVDGEGALLVGGAISSVGLLGWWIWWWKSQPEKPAEPAV